MIGFMINYMRSVQRHDFAIVYAKNVRTLWEKLAIDRIATYLK